MWKNPEALTENQQVMPAWIAATDPTHYRAYLLKVLQMPYKAAVTALDLEPGEGGSNLVKT